MFTELVGYSARMRTSPPGPLSVNGEGESAIAPPTAAAVGDRGEVRGKAYA